MDSKSTDVQGEDGLALTERRWNEVSNLREASLACPNPFDCQAKLPTGENFPSPIVGNKGWYYLPSNGMTFPPAKGV